MWVEGLILLKILLLSAIIGNFLFTSSHHYLRVYSTTEMKYIAQLNKLDKIENAPYYSKLFNWNNEYLIALRARAVEVWELPITNKSKTFSIQCIKTQEFEFNNVPFIAFNSTLLYVYYGINIMIIKLKDVNEPSIKETSINSDQLNSLIADETSLWFGTKSGIIYQLSTKFSDNSTKSDEPKIFYDLQKRDAEKMYPIIGIQKNDNYLVANVCKGNQIMIWDLAKVNEYRVIICPGCVKIRLFDDYLICGAGVFFCIYDLGKKSEKEKKSDLTKPIFIGGVHLKPLVNLAISSNIIASTDKCGCIVLTEVKLK